MNEIVPSSPDPVEKRNSKSLPEILKAAGRDFDAVATGAMGMSKSELLMIPGRLFQGFRNKVFVNQLERELEELRSRGRIRSDFDESESSHASFQQLLAALEDPPVDQKKFDALKAVFLASALDEPTLSVDLQPALLLQIVGGLSSGEIVLLAAAYRTSTITSGERKGRGHLSNVNVSEWREAMAKESGLAVVGLVELYEKSLVEKLLLTAWIYPDRSGAKIGPRQRLTDLGLRVCEYWKAYEDEKARSDN